MTTDDFLYVIVNAIKEAQHAREERVSVNEKSDSEYCMALLQELTGRTRAEIINNLRALFSLSRGSVMCLLYSILAKEFDAAYPAHISECKHIYIINPLDAKVYKVDTCNVKKPAFNYFAAFRTKEDAIKAIKIAGALKKLL